MTNKHFSQPQSSYLPITCDFDQMIWKLVYLNPSHAVRDLSRLRQYQP